MDFKISTHVLDTSKGLPVKNLKVKLYRMNTENDWIYMSEGITTDSGRVAGFSSDIVECHSGTYKLHFLVKPYYDSINAKTLYPFIDIIFEVDQSQQHYHIPLLLSAFGFTTYRGS